MNESENAIKNILRGLDVPIVESKNLKYKKVKVLNCESIINDGYEEIIGKNFNILFEFKDTIIIEFNSENISLKTGEYEIIKE